MSLHLEFEPHAWYMGFAIRNNRASGHDNSQLERPLESTEGHKYSAYTDNGNTYRIDELHADTLDQLREYIRAYHLKARNGYGERIAARRLEYLRGELQAERISYGELAELQGLASYIADDDVELLEPAGVPEGSRV